MLASSVGVSGASLDDVASSDFDSCAAAGAGATFPNEPKREVEEAPKVNPAGGAADEEPNGLVEVVGVPNGLELDVVVVFVASVLGVGVGDLLPKVKPTGFPMLPEAGFADPNAKGEDLEEIVPDGEVSVEVAVEALLALNKPVDAFVESVSPAPVAVFPEEAPNENPDGLLSAVVEPNGEEDGVPNSDCFGVELLEFPNSGVLLVDDVVLGNENNGALLAEVPLGVKPDPRVGAVFEVEVGLDDEPNEKAAGGAGGATVVVGGWPNGDDDAGPLLRVPFVFPADFALRLSYSCSISLLLFVYSSKKIPMSTNALFL